jgi:hypothetical protein
MSVGVNITTSEPFARASIVVFDKDKIPLVHVNHMMNIQTRGIDGLKKKLSKQEGLYVSDAGRFYNGAKHFQYCITEKGLRYLLATHFDWPEDKIELGCKQVFHQVPASKKRNITDLLAEQEEMVAVKAMKWYVKTDEFKIRVEQEVQIRAQRIVDEMRPQLEEQVRQQVEQKIAQEVEEMRKSAIQEASLPDESINYDYYGIDRDEVMKNLKFY